MSHDLDPITTPPTPDTTPRNNTTDTPNAASDSTVVGTTPQTNDGAARDDHTTADAGRPSTAPTLTRPAFLEPRAATDDSRAKPDAGHGAVPLLRRVPATGSRSRSDADEAMRSLDDTVMRPMPHLTTMWDAEPIRRAAPEEAPHRPYIRTGLLVGAVAIVSFVAGGVTARLSAQMPLLFASSPQPVETAAVRTPVEQEEETEPETYAPVSDEPSVPTYDPSRDTGYDDTETQVEQQIEEQTPVEEQTDQVDQQTTEEESPWTWHYDDGNGGSIGYTYDDGRVIVNYDGYSLSVPIGDLVDDSTRDQLWSMPTTDSPFRTYGNDDTGYDSPGYSNRDSYGWNGTWS